MKGVASSLENYSPSSSVWIAKSKEGVRHWTKSKKRKGAGVTEKPASNYLGVADKRPDRNRFQSRPGQAKPARGGLTGG